MGHLAWSGSQGLKPPFLLPAPCAGTEVPASVEATSLRSWRKLPAYLRSNVTPGAEVPAYLRSNVTPGAEVPAYLRSNVTPGTEVPAYLRSNVTPGAEVPAYLRSNVTPGAEVPAYLRSNVTPGTEVPAYLRSNVTPGTEVPAYLRGNVTPGTEVPAYLRSNVTPGIKSRPIETRHLRFGSGGFFGEGGEDGLFDGLPAAFERVHDDGFDEQEDVFGRGVVSADHGALGFVQGALEEGAEDDGLDVGPVVLGGGVEDAEVGIVEQNSAIVGEESAVEVGDIVRPEEAAIFAHGLEEEGQHAVEADGRVTIVLDHAAEGVVGKEADGVRKEAEDEAHEELRDFFFGGAFGRSGAFEFDPLGEAEEVRRGGFGYANDATPGRSWL